MDKRRLVVLAVRLAICLAIGSMAWAAGTETSIPKDSFTYPPTHYLAGDRVLPGFDSFGMDLLHRHNNALHMNTVLCWQGYPPYEGDDAAYFERLVAEGFAGDIGEAQAMMEAQPQWWKRTWRCEHWWNDLYYSDHLDLNGDGHLDAHPFGPLGPGLTPFEPVGERGSGAAVEGIYWNLYSTGPGDEQPGSQHLALVAVPVDAVRIPGPGGMWYDASGNEIGFDFGPPTENNEDCWACVRLDCLCYGELVNRYRSPSKWGKVRVRGQG